jgi:hypothetical protein
LVDRCRVVQLAVVGPRRRGFELVLFNAIDTRLLSRAGARC